MGAGQRRRPLHPLVSTAHGRHRREARFVLGSRRQRRRDRVVLGQGAGAAGARRVVVPQRRHPQHVRGPRLFGVGPHIARLHRRHHALHPDGIHIVHGRGVGLQGASAARNLGRGQSRHGGVPLLRQECQPRIHIFGLGAGVFPRRRESVGRASRPRAHGPHANGSRVGQEPAVGGSLLRRHPLARNQFHERLGVREPQTRHSAQDPSQRGGAQPVRTGSRVRGGQFGQRPQPVADDHNGQDRAPSQLPRTAAREAFQGNQRIRQAQQLVAGYRHGSEPLRPGQNGGGESAIHNLPRERHGSRVQA